MRARELSSIGAWKQSGGAAPAFDEAALVEAIARVREPLHIVRELGRDGAGGRLGVAFGGALVAPAQVNGAPVFPLLASLPALYPEWLGDRSFLETHGVRFPYVAGEMANGIATPAMVIAMARGGMLGFYGAAGLARARVEAGLDEIQAALAGTGLPWGANLIHSPNEPDLEHAVADLFLRRGVERVCASAYMGLTPSIVRYAASGLSLDAAGNVARKHHVFAKVSRAEVARHFVSPAPREMLAALVAKGELTPAEAELAARVPIAEDVTVEADSGGHTDNRPLVAQFPTIRALVEEIAAQHGYSRPIRVGAAGGLGTPASVAAAFALGAAYVVTGSVNQAALESGLSLEGKALLAQAGIADVMMAPAADMFELGVKVQVLRRGTMFGVRAARLYDVYRDHSSLEAIPASLRAQLESQIFGATLDEVWQGTRAFFEKRDPREIAKAEADPKHRMALVFRWYLGKASRWAIDGEPARKLDFQIWCGPAMGAFNAWTAGSFLASPEHRGVVQIAKNLLEGAAVVTRAQQLRSYGVAVPSRAFDHRPRPLD